MKVLFRAEMVPQVNSGIFESCKIPIDNRTYLIGTESYDEHGIYYITSWSTKDKKFHTVECKEKTRSINFEDMIDSEGTKIFASISEDGIGGDVIRYGGFRMGICKYKEQCIMVGAVSLRDVLLLSKHIQITKIKEQQ